MKIVGLIGDSGSGKTTAITALIQHFVGRSLTVGAVKHTHHSVNVEDRGDTAAFRRAGAAPVILAGQGEAVIFDKNATTVMRFERPLDLLASFATDVVLIEGFRSVDAWPRIELSRDRRRSLQELLAIVDRI